MFKPGDEVVCVDESIGAYTGRKDFTLGQTYVVEEFRAKGEVGNTAPLSADSLQIVGVAYVAGAGFWGHAASRFRKVQKRSTETGMAILRGLLDANPVKTLEPSQSE